MHALGKFEQAIAGSSFVVRATDDWTPGVLAAVEADSSRRAAEITASVPSFLSEAALSFASTIHSSTYRALREGRASYRRYVLEFASNR